MSYSIPTTSSIKNEIKNTVSISLPLIASQLIYACSGFIGTVMVAHLGQDALAASVLVSMIWMALLVFFIGILNAVSILVAHQYGARNVKAISEIMGQSYIVGIAISLIMIIILYFLPHLLHWSKQPPQVLKLAHEYIFSLIWTIPTLVMLIINEQFLAAIGRAKIVLRISLLIVPIEIPIIYILVFGKFGFPQCGIAGIGYGFAISYALTAIGLALFLGLANHYKKYELFYAVNRVNWNYIKELILVGLPMGFMHLIEVSTFAIGTFWIAQFGTTILAAHQITIQFLNFFIMIIFAMSQAVTIRVGHNIGERNVPGTKYASYIGALLSFCIMAIVAVILIAFPNLLLMMDIDIHNPANAQLINNTTMLLSICAITLIFDNFRVIGFGALRGLKDTRFPMYTTFISFWIIGLPLAYLFGFIFHYSGQGIWWGLTLGILTGAIIVYARLQKLLKKIDFNKILMAHNNEE